MRSPEELLGVAEDGVKRALARGADAAEVYVVEASSASITAFGTFAVPKQHLGADVGVRVAVGNRMGISGAPGLHRVDVAIEQALEAARHLPEGKKPIPFAPARHVERDPFPLDPELAEVDVARVSAAAEAAVQALVAHPATTYAGATLKSWRRRFAVANAEGVRAWDETAGEILEIEARVTEGSRERTAMDVWFGNRPLEADVDVAAFATAAVNRARDALDAAPLTGDAVEEVILHPLATNQLLQLFSHALNGKRAHLGRSPLAERVGDTVASEQVTLRDLPHGPVGASHRRIDDEGTPTRATTLVASGRLEGFLYDAATAHETGHDPTGNGMRAGVYGGIQTQPVNFVMEPGDASIEELVEGAERAVLVNEPLMGSFVANDVTGDFSVVAPFAFLVEGGRVRRALPPTTIGGNVHTVLRSVRALGRDRQTCPAGVFPAMRAGGVSCAN